jgi:hypothetical protein
MELNEFLVTAKANTYATAGEGGEEILYDGAKELIFGQGDFKYRDRYLGANPFIGQEIVWQNDQKLWGMNYYGEIFDKSIIGDLLNEFLDFLKLSLRQVPAAKPFRGPAQFKKDRFEYICESQGNVGKFIGFEKILYQGGEVYRLDFHGGLIK